MTDKIICLPPGDTFTPIEPDWKRLALEQIAALRVINVLLRDSANAGEAATVAWKVIQDYDATAAMRFVMTSTRDPA